MSIPVDNFAIDKAQAESLRALFSDFDFKRYANFYNFIYDNIEINISNEGAVLISLVSASDCFENISILSKILNKINSIIYVKEAATKISTRDLN